MSSETCLKKGFARLLTNILKGTGRFLSHFLTCLVFFSGHGMETNASHHKNQQDVDKTNARARLKFNTISG